MLNPISLPVRSYSQVNHPYQPCSAAGPSYVSAMTYMQARNFVISDRDTPSVTLVGKLFDAVLETSPVQAVVKTLDSWGRYIFDVCETPDPSVSKKRLHPALIVVLMSGHGRNLTQPEPNCTTDIAIKSVENGKQINNTVTLTLLQNNKCFNWGKESVCVGVFYETYFIDKSPTYELYNFSESLGSNEWNYNNRSWQVSCKGQFDLPASFISKVQKDLERVIICVDKKTKEEFIYLGLIFGIPVFVVLTFCGLKAAGSSFEEKSSDPHMPERPTPIYGTFAL